MIGITVNDVAERVDDDATVADLVAAIGVGPKGVAVAVNGEVVPRSAWSGSTLRVRDRVEVLHAVQGGCT